MIDAATGQPAPCPMCASHEVRWRERGIRDRVLNSLRYGVEAFFRTAFGWRKQSKPSIGWGTHFSDPGLPNEHFYAHERHAFDEQVSAAVPRWFWSCRACKREGHVFEEVFEPVRKRVAQLEDQLRDVGVGVRDPVDRDGLQ